MKKQLQWKLKLKITSISFLVMKYTSLIQDYILYTRYQVIKIKISHEMILNLFICIKYNCHNIDFLMLLSFLMHNPGSWDSSFSVLNCTS